MTTAQPPPQWDPDLYRRFERERARPFFDLLYRIPDGEIRAVADLGCGPGTLTVRLLERWPDARVWGVDSSPAMLESAARLPSRPNLLFVNANLADWRADRPLDRIVSNAALHWVPDHAGLLRHLVSSLAAAGVLAVQMPNNFSSAALRLLYETAAEEPWARALHDWGERFFVESPSWYAETLQNLGLVAQVWETVYYPLLSGDDPVLEWLKGTALRPVLSRLQPELQSSFLAELGTKLRAAYPVGRHGTMFPFRRLFFIAERR